MDNMKELLSHYRELLAQTQLYLHREHSYQTMLPVDPSTFVDYPKKVTPTLMQPTFQPKQTTPPVPQPVKIQAPVAVLSAPAVSLKPSILSQVQPNPATPKREESIEHTTAPTPPAPLPQPSVSKPTAHAKKVELEPFTACATQDLSDYWKLHRQLFPDINLTETFPKDCAALKVKNAWQNELIIPPVVILAFRDVEKELVFLRNVAQAISLRLAPARVISASKWGKENGWTNLINSPNLRLVVATDYDLYLQPELMKMYREVPQQGKHYLQNIPLLLLSDLSLYLKEPQLKSLLWRAICNEFATPSTP